MHLCVCIGACAVISVSCLSVARDAGYGKRGGHHDALASRQGECASQHFVGSVKKRAKFVQDLLESKYRK